MNDWVERQLQKDYCKGSQISYQVGFKPRPTRARRSPRRRTTTTGSSSRGDLAAALTDLQPLTERLRRDCPWDREQTARDDRAAHDRGGLRGRRRRARRRRREAARRARRPALPDLLPRAPARRSAAPATSSRWRAAIHDEARPPAPARLRRRRGATPPAACSENWERIKREQEGREGIFHDVAEALPGTALRAQGAAAREARRLRVPGRRRRARRPRRRARAS